MAFPRQVEDGFLRVAQEECFVLQTFEACAVESLHNRILTVWLDLDLRGAVDVAETRAPSQRARFWVQIADKHIGLEIRHTR